MVLISMASLAAASGQAPPASAPNPGLIQARQRAAAGQVAEAIEILRAQLERQPGDLESRLALAELYANQGDRSAAEAEFREALGRHPRSGEAALALGKFYLDRGALAQAEPVLARALRNHPALGQARLQLTLALAGEHRYAEAERNLPRIPLPADPAERMRYYRLRASIHSGLGESRAAAEDMEKALAAAPQDEQLQTLTALTEAEASDWNACAPRLARLFAENPTARIGLPLLQAQLATRQDFSATLRSLQNLSLPPDQGLRLALRSAELLAGSEHHREAADEYALALELAGRNRDVAYNLALERYAAGDLDGALQQLQLLREQADSADVDDLAGEIEEQRGDTAAALRDHEQAVALAPSEERYRLTLGTTLLQAHSYPAAAEVFEQAIGAFPASSRSYVGLALADSLMEQYDQSASAFLRAEQLEPDSGRILNYLGSTQVDNPSGPSPLAVHALCSRAEAHPRDPVAAEWCGALLFRKAYLAGDRAGSDSAIAHLRSAIALAPKEAVAYCAMGRALFWSRRTAEARHWLETCVRMEPDSSEAHYRLSLAYRELHMPEAAARQSALAESLKGKADSPAPAHPSLALQMLALPARPGLHAPTKAGPAPASP